MTNSIVGIATVINLHDNNSIANITLPCNFEDMKARFKEEFGFCNVQSEREFKCYGMYSQYKYESCGNYSFSEANNIAEKLAYYENELGEKYLQAFFDFACYSYSDLDVLVDDTLSFYDSKETYLNFIYDGYNLTSVKFLHGTVDAFLHDDYVFHSLELQGNVIEADNGVIIEFN